MTDIMGIFSNNTNIKNNINIFLVRKVIREGNWYTCEGQYYDELLQFKMRFTNFKRISLEEIDGKYDDELEGNLWILKLEVISLNKFPIEGWKVKQLLQLQDHEKFIFEPFDGGKLDTDRKNGLHRFSGWSDNPPLSPKLKAKGSVLFVLPKEEARYSILIKDGSLSKI